MITSLPTPDTLTPSQARLLDLLRSGEAYGLFEIKRHMGDEFMEDMAVRKLVGRLRETVERHGFLVICNHYGRYKAGTYQLVRRITSGE